VSLGVSVDTNLYQCLYDSKHTINTIFVQVAAVRLVQLIYIKSLAMKVQNCLNATVPRTFFFGTIPNRIRRKHL
jgi:hypothetical protein